MHQYAVSCGKGLKAFGKLDNIFQDMFNEIISQQSTNVTFFLPHN